MKFVIINEDTRRYVLPPGRAGSYTPRLEEARVFPSREAAEAECCGNEQALAVEDVVGSR